MKKIVLQKEQTTVSFLETGDLFEIMVDDIMVNQLNGNSLDGSLNQLYLRVHADGEIFSTPMIGSNATSEFSYSENQLNWKGQFMSMDYQVSFQIAEKNTWFWRVTLAGPGEAEIIYGQDIGNATRGAIQSNEAYMSQYLDHHVSKIDQRVVISSRQNQEQNGHFPVIEQGSFQPIHSYSTDGYQFFGRSYKETNVPEILTKEQLANEVYQYEFAYIALQTEKRQLSTTPQEYVFYGAFKKNQDSAITEPLFQLEEIKQRYSHIVLETPTKGVSFKKNLTQPLVGEMFTESEIRKRFPLRQQVEIVDGQIYSFFTEENRHVVLKEKEVSMERAHGHVLLSGKDLTVDTPLMSTTVYMYGVFNSQVVLGNTSMNKLMSNTRNMLNTIKISGQRLYILDNEKWRLLTMPSAFEMGLNSVKWYYKTENDILIVNVYTINKPREIRMEVTSENGYSYVWAVSNHLLMGPDDEATFTLKKEQQVLEIVSQPTSAIANVYPELVYYMTCDKEFTVESEELFINRNDNLLTILKINQVDSFTLRIQGSLSGESYRETTISYEEATKEYLEFIRNLLNNFELMHSSKDVQRMNLLAHWYTHNMLVHYLSPHGLEQYGGAAWGTRDVSQGPTEFFFAVNRPEIVSSIIENMYANQFEDNGNWPQWFMFDRYETQKASESHGDVIVWPMKVVADYLEKTGDYQILDRKIPYTSRKTFLKTEATATLYDHIKKEILYIEENFLEGTYLSCYGDGDWDDTLQPYDSKLKKHMASSWTVALTYQVLNKLSRLLRRIDTAYSHHLEELVAGIQSDFNKYILESGTIPGFVYMENANHVELMIHPEDKKTGIQYRLLPMTRSMIAELLTPEQVARHLEIIREQLTFPDGVRLMNRPANYQGGVSRNFKRAEQSANFGREIGLQYVHAHIRYTEAMAKLGEKADTWNALEKINPIQIKEYVPNAEIRQANAYFSSSDGDFKTRYEAQENFGKLREGSYKVKGGWRIYSSGPGIYLNQLITNVLGIRESHETLILDPILPEELDGLTMKYKLFGKSVTIVFHQSDEKRVRLNGEELSYSFEENRYRQGGFKLSTKELFGKLQEENQLDIYH